MPKQYDTAPTVSDFENWHNIICAIVKTADLMSNRSVLIKYGSNEMHLNHHDKSRNQMMCIPLKMVELSSFRCCSIYFFYYFSVFIFASRNFWNSKNKTHSLSDCVVIVLISANVKRHLCFVLSNEHVIHTFSSS